MSYEQLGSGLWIPRERRSGSRLRIARRNSRNQGGKFSDPVGSTPGAPTMVWATGASVLTPQFTITGAFQAGDTLEYELQVSGGNWSSPIIDTTHLVTGAEASGDTVDLGLGPLGAGTYDARCRFNHSGTDYSAWSNVVTQTLTIGPPAITAQGASTFPPDGTSVPINIGAGDLVLVLITGYSLSNPVTVSGSTLGAFTQATYQQFGGTVHWKKNNGGALVNEVISCSTDHPPNWHVFSLSGADGVSPFDPAGFPFTAAPSVAASLQKSITTTLANTRVFAWGIGPGAYDAGWTPATTETPYGEIIEHQSGASIGTYTAYSGVNNTGSIMLCAVKSG